MRYNFSLFSSLCLLFFSCSSKFDGKNGIKTVYFPGSFIVEQTIAYKNGKRNGEFKEFYRNGTIKMQQFFVNDTLTDSSLAYYENGNLKFSQYLKNGVREGTWKKYNELGKVVESVDYKNRILRQLIFSPAVVCF